MLNVTAAGWALTIALITGLFVFDLVLSGRRPHQVTFREAAGWSAFYVGCAIAFGVAFGAVAGWDFAVQYFSGYVVEKSLSIDNVFVFAIIMATFAVPSRHQHRALTIGIAVALGLRAVFIAAGAALISAFSVTLLVFGGLLMFTGVQLFRHRDQDPDVDQNPLVGAARRFLPMTDRYDEGRLITVEGGRRVFTPLALVLVAIGGTDMLFALDSIPAVFGVTREAYIVFVVNAFALLGLRALYFLVAGLLDRFVYLSTGLAVVLVFIGAKLVLHFGHEQSSAVPEISTGASLGVIALVLGVAAGASVIATRRDPGRRAHAGTVREPRPARVSSADE